jgi:hypothetical protein
LVMMMHLLSELKLIHVELFSYMSKYKISQ